MVQTSLLLSSLFFLSLRSGILVGDMEVEGQVQMYRVVLKHCLATPLSSTAACIASLLVNEMRDLKVKQSWVHWHDYMVVTNCDRKWTIVNGVSRDGKS